MSTALQNFVPLNILGSGINSGGDIVTVIIDNSNSEQMLSYVPKRFTVCGKDDNDIVYPIQLSSDNELLP